jgi:L-amino acid N-acyltransferase YncA
MHIRTATSDDLQGIQDIYNDAVLNTTASYDYEPRTMEGTLSWYEKHVAGNYPIFVAVHETDGIVGWSSLSQYRERPGHRFTTENSVYVASKHRGCGVGKLLMPPLISAAGERGLHAIIAAIDASNEVSIRLHHRFGFEKVGMMKQTGFKFGRWLDVVFMELLLPPPGANSNQRPMAH